ncbi:MAG: redoxin family protein [Sphingopyxis sp.]
MKQAPTSAPPPSAPAGGPEPAVAPAGGARWVIWLPLAFIALIGAAFAWGLAHGGQGRVIESQWINQPFPLVTLPAATAGVAPLSTRNFADGQPRLVNIFASWCIPCRVEAPALAALKARGVRIEGVAVRDRPDDLARFLAETGNPYSAIGADARSEVQLALGSSGVPETFLVDGHGIIREQIQGAIDPARVPEIIAKLQWMQR